MCVVVGQVGLHPVGKMSQYSGKVSVRRRDRKQFVPVRLLRSLTSGSDWDPRP